MDAHPALVVGLSIHGLAVVRALARQGVTVHCLAEIEDPPQPTVRTRYARVHIRRGLNTSPLTTFLREVAAEIGGSRKIVLFPTSDRIAKAIAHAWGDLSEYYLLSWSHCRDLVEQLQRKDRLAEYAERAGINHPRSKTLHDVAGCAAVVEGLRFPLVVKPVQPLSSFKAIRLGNQDELQACVVKYAKDLPFVVQEWVDGPEPSLYSCTTYLDRGECVFTLTSRKIAAVPPGLGQGTVFETIAEPRVADLAVRFLRQMDLSGPVAVEFKRDADGEFWMIEPNVGRTEYCVDLAVQSGFNLPYVEYLHVTGQPIGPALSATTRPCAWFDTDKDPGCFLANLRLLRGQNGERRKAVFPFFGQDDWRPLATSGLQQLRGALSAVRRRVVRTLRPRQT